VDHEGNIGGISVTVTYESFGTRRLVHQRFENPPAIDRIAEGAYLLHVNSMTAIASC
jgi:hypothetical protein